jgi:hypothetical protein
MARPFEVNIGETGVIRIELIERADSADRAVYRYRIQDEAAGIDYEATDLHLGPRLRPDNTLAAKTLVSDLRESGEAWTAGHAIEADRFPESVNVWAANRHEELEMAHVQLGRGLEAGR